MRLMAAAVLALVCSCGDQAAPRHSATIADASMDGTPGGPGPSGGVHLLSASPATAGVSGQTMITVTYDGTLPQQISMLVDGIWTYAVVDASAHTFTFRAPPHVAGPATLQVRDSNELVVASSSDLLAYAVLPATPRLVFSPQDRASLQFSLRPELTRPCARLRVGSLVNDGDISFNVTGFMSTDPSFTLQTSSQCNPVTATNSCSFIVCFDSAVSGTHSTTAVFQTSAGDLSAPFAATVLPSVPDLDPSFNTLGGLAIGTRYDGYENVDAWYIGGARSIAGGDRVLVWSRSLLMNVDRATSSESDQSLYTTVNGFLVNWIRGVRASTPGGGVFVLLGDSSGGSISTLFHLDDQGLRDTQFGEIDLPFGGDGPGYFRGLELAAGGRVLALGSNQVVAMSLALRAVDTTWGTAGVVTLPAEFKGSSAIDSQGRVYLGLSDRVVRLTPTGAIDSGFTFTGAVGSLTIDSSDHVFVGVDGYAALLSNAGAIVTQFASTSVVTDVAVDASGRVYVTSGGTVRRYSSTGTFDRTLGFGNASGACCGGTGVCWIWGVNHIPTTQNDYPLDEIYTLRLAN